MPVHTFLRSGLAAVLALALLGVEPAAAAQDPRLKKVEAQVADLESKAESAAEDWNAARMKLRASELRVAALKRKASTEREIGRAHV